MMDDRREWRVNGDGEWRGEKELEVWGLEVGGWERMWRRENGQVQ